MIQKPEHELLLRWLILTGFIVFLSVVAWNEGIITLLFNVDKSRISSVIALLYLLVTLHCAGRIHTLSLEGNLYQQIEGIIKNEKELKLEISDNRILLNSGTTLPDCFTSDYITDLYYHNRNTTTTREMNNPTDLIDVYESRLKGPQETGWFVTDLMLKLGLLGTITGFIFMLGSVANITDFDISNMQKILRHMSNGMGTALYTTLIGLVCSILAAIQYHMLDRHADKLLEQIRHLTQVRIIPGIN